MTTINALSYSTFTDAIMEFIKLRDKYLNRVSISFNYLRHPSCLDVQNLPVELKQKWVEEMKVLMTHFRLHGQTRMEIERVMEYILVEPDSETKLTNQKDLVFYTRELDRRRGLDFPTTFPELHALLPVV